MSQRAAFSRMMAFAFSSESSPPGLTGDLFKGEIRGMIPIPANSFV